MDWMLFEQLDRLRRAQGALLDAGGWRSREAPYRVVHEQAGIALRRYDGGEGSPVVLIVPAPIKGPYLWDLDPEVSVVRRLLERALQVYVLEWRAAPPDYGLEQYGERLIVGCLDAVGAARAVLLGHSLGGLLAAIFATLHPERVSGLGLLAAPLHFGADTPVLNALVAELNIEALPDSLPGSFLSVASANAAPAVFGVERALDAALSAADPVRLRIHLLVERWSLDELALPRRLVAELATQCIRDDRFVRGALQIGGRIAAPSRLEAPVLCVMDNGCPLVPPAAILPFLDAVASRDKTVLAYERDVGVALQHVGPLVARSAHAHLWPRILDWIERVGAPA
ncbi:MAG TPA: alpha/beta fold hydrolase [Burkholderiales bacterium]|jgi:polyhydroxyalkanoate synthase|nr:alpha/beta fold hydrolase [Burkholderiales bacterium]